MTDDIKKLKAAFRELPPAVARDGAKASAIERAMAAFDEKKSFPVQGSSFGTRLRGTANAVYKTLIGRRPMRLNPALAGGASLSVLLVAALSATYIHTSGGKIAPREESPPPAAAQKPSRGQAADTDTKSKADEQLAPAAETRGAGRLAPGVAPLLVPKSLRGVQPDAAPPPAPAAGMVPAPAPLARNTAPMNKPGGGLPRHFRNQGAVLQQYHDALRLHRDQRAIAPDRPAPGTYQDQGRDRFEQVASNPVKVTAEEPVSTFSIDVDTVSYGFVRSSLNNNVLPHKDAVRVEELINYFPYDYAKPDDRSVPFKANVSVFPSPWNADRKLVHIGIAGFDLRQDEKPRSNLVFLLDTSGSMNTPNKLPLVINSMKLLLDTLHPDDTVAIVTYAGDAGTVLEPTELKDKAKIVQALNNLRPAGSTAGAEGIRQAYELARQGFRKDGVNRVILATDGDFNVGITSKDELKSYIERQRKTGIFLSVLGFGRGNYNDALMQALAQNGNGAAAYIDTLNEARKVLVEEASSTLFPIARDVKIQMEFNPAKVAEYRLIGYETRLLRREDFNNDKVDAGDIGAGHRVTAIYEITPAGSQGRAVDTLRYGPAQTPQAAAGRQDEYGFLKIRYKLPKEDISKLITAPVGAAAEHASLEAAPNEARFATAVAAFGQILTGGRHTGSFSYDDVIALAQGAKGPDEFGYRAEFINLVRLAKSAPAMDPLRR